MRLFKGVVIASVLLGVLYSCSPLKKVEESKKAALSTYSDQNYEQAYNQLISVISSYKSANLEVPNNLFLKTADCASRLANYTGAADYYNQALNDSVTLEGVKGYVVSVKGSGDNNRRAELLVKYADFLKKAGDEEYLVKQLFDVAIKTKDDEGILKTFPKLKSATEDQSMTYLKALESVGNNKVALKFCNQLVKENDTYYKAKEWKAVYYYNLADKGYKKEMAKYNKNKTYTAYVYLKRDLKKVSTKFRIAKSLFEELRKQNPTENKYIKYLKNIYLRLDMKKEASAMEKLLK